MKCLALVLSVALAACTMWLEPDRAQCDSNADCRRFANTMCHVPRGVCIPEVASAPAEVRADAMVDVLPVDVLPKVPATSAPQSNPCARTNRPLVRIEGDITRSDSLTCAANYLLVGSVFVKSGATLTIEKGTTIFGDGPSRAVLVVQPGAKLVANGTASEPVVFTSAAPAPMRAAGDWGGVILLGRAPVNAEAPMIEGITDGGEYGGTDPNDDSGSLRYVRIEYGGTKLGPNNEVNGLTFGGVGSKTVVDFVQVRHTADDCFEFFGGTVNAKHLVCYQNGDDGFDWDLGYRGKLQFLVLQQDAAVVDETNGFEGDNDATGTSRAPQSEPIIYNATLVGKNVDVDKEQYAMLLRRSTKAHIFNVVAVGFEAAVDVRDAATKVEIGSSVFFGNTARAFAYEEDGSNAGVQKNDDAGFDEMRTLLDPATKNAVADPRLGAPFNVQPPDFVPMMPLTAQAATPPGDGFFDATAAFMGAVRDRGDRWLEGAWISWSSR